ncbi:ABC transporter permease [Candidatus Omnitrophota bacterium]
MARFLARRIFALIPLFFGITLVTFFVIKLAPGRPTDLQTSLNPKISYEARQRLARLEGLDKPVIIQYADWLRNFISFDFGVSSVDGRRVSGKIVERLGITLTINILSMSLILLAAIPLGIMASLKRGSFLDKLTTVFVFVGFSAPGFWLALMLMSYFGISLQLLPISGIKSVNFEYLSLSGKIVDVARHLTLPVLISAFGGLAGISRYTRSSMVNVIRQDYIVTARAKGIREKDVIYRHALRNALLPIITILGLSIPGLIGGSVIFESVFAIPGMGRLFFESVMARDIRTIMGILSIGAVLTLLGNFLADISYALADPRIRISGERR